MKEGEKKRWNDGKKDDRKGKEGKKDRRKERREEG